MPQIANWPKTRAEAQAILQSHPNPPHDTTHTCKVCNDLFYCERHPQSHRVRSFCSRQCYYRHQDTNPSFQRYRQSDKGKAMRQRVVSKSASRPEAIARRAQHQRWEKLVLTLDPSQRPFNTTPWPICTTNGCNNILPSRIAASCRYCAWQQRIANRPNTWRNAGKPCKECGKPLTRYQGKYCSPVCRSRAQDKLFRKNNPDAYRAQKRRARKRRNEKRRLLKLEAAKNGEFIRNCIHCDKQFDAYRPKGLIPNLCSKRCERRARDFRRRAMKRNAFVEVVSVKKLAKWQGWKCHLCGGLIDKLAKAPHPKSLTLEHLVPLAKGGEHSYRNCVAAHFYCNSIKSDRAIGEQLKLL